MATKHLTVARSARIELFGHPPRPAHLEIVVYPRWARVARTVGFVMLWVGSTALTLVLTFDPFIASFPFLIGAWLVYNSWRGKYRVQAFRGSCPRCDEELKVEPGSKIRLPHAMVCYHCHFEPELAV